ncbi:unnamed protein product [Pleuronectes platessa]|uniref:Uncharacterized protein n=1 Tax=Pleuronectes platessa TaxID=8262 RepID=A0A9N7VKG9_PLEPL|nr:unnamed protein product [Pleuronectes platessa]
MRPGEQQLPLAAQIGPGSRNKMKLICCFALRSVKGLDRPAVSGFRISICPAHDQAERLDCSGRGRAGGSTEEEHICPLTATYTGAGAVHNENNTPDFQTEALASSNQHMIPPPSPHSRRVGRSSTPSQGGKIPINYLFVSIICAEESRGQMTDMLFIQSDFGEAPVDSVRRLLKEEQTGGESPSLWDCLTLSDRALSRARLQGILVSLSLPPGTDSEHVTFKGQLKVSKFLLQERAGAEDGMEFNL